jgi:hypothetical protein
MTAKTKPARSLWAVRISPDVNLATTYPRQSDTRTMPPTTTIPAVNVGNDSSREIIGYGRGKSEAAPNVVVCVGVSGTPEVTS